LFLDFQIGLCFCFFRYVEQEQEQEQQQEQEQVEDEVPKKKFSRKDEKVHPWTFSSLVNHPSAKKQNFYSLSELAVFKTLKHRPRPIRFPDMLYYSPNYFYQPWSFNTHRRMKNIIISLEWCPNRQQVVIADQGYQYGTASLTKADNIDIRLTDEQEARLRKSFDLFDTDKNGLIDKVELRELLRALDAVTPDGEAEEFGPIIQHLMEHVSTNKESLSYSDVKKMIINSNHGRVQSGRFYVVVTLQEAESIRGHIHLQQLARSMVVPNSETTIGLRCGSYLLDGSYRYVPAMPYQQDTAEVCLRFADCDIYYTERNLNLLLRALQRNSLDARRDWFDEVRSCKRRQQIPWEKTSLHKVFTVNDEYHILEHKALVSRVRTLIRLKAMLMMDAFRVFDQDRDGKLNCSELYAAAHWLGLTELAPNDIYDMMRTYDSTHTGTLNYADFARTFKDPDEDADIYAHARSQMQPLGLTEVEPGSVADVTNIVIPPMKIKGHTYNTLMIHSCVTSSRFKLTRFSVCSVSVLQSYTIWISQSRKRSRIK
jgi:Ca2+-binding EF-hand superfamily protein